MLDNAGLKCLVSKSGDARRAARSCRTPANGVRDGRAAGVPGGYRRGTSCSGARASRSTARSRSGSTGGGAVRRRRGRRRRWRAGAGAGAGAAQQALEPGLRARPACNWSALPGAERRRRCHARMPAGVGNTSISGRRVVRELADLVAKRGKPDSVRRGASDTRSCCSIVPCMSLANAAHIQLVARDDARNIRREYRIERSVDLFGHRIVDGSWGGSAPPGSCGGLRSPVTARLSGSCEACCSAGIPRPSGLAYTPLPSSTGHRRNAEGV